nr:MAG TPA: hypothetical protein [Caudoviricetes sp.]
MSWVKVTNGKMTVEIPQQAFIDLYERNGYVIVSDEVKSTPTLNNAPKQDKENEKNELQLHTRRADTKHKTSSAKQVPVAHRK